MTTDLRDKTVDEWIDHLGNVHDAGCDGDHGTMSYCNQHNLIEVLERRLSEAQQQIAHDAEIIKAAEEYRTLLLWLYREGVDEHFSHHSLGIDPYSDRVTDEMVIAAVRAKKGEKG